MPSDNAAQMLAALLVWALTPSADELLEVIHHHLALLALLSPRQLLLLPVDDDIAGILRRMRPRCQR